MLVAEVAHDDHRHVRRPSECCSFLHRRGDCTLWVLPTEAHLAANRGTQGKLSWNGSILLGPVGCIVDPQGVRLARNQLQRHRLGTQGDTRFVDEQLTVQEEASCPQVRQRQGVLPGYWRSKA